MNSPVAGSEWTAWNSSANLSPWGQLRAPRLPRRLLQLVVGLTLYGVSMGMMVESHLGLDPWDVFHDGVAGAPARSASGWS